MEQDRKLNFPKFQNDVSKILEEVATLETGGGGDSNIAQEFGGNLEGIYNLLNAIIGLTTLKSSLYISKDGVITPVYLDTTPSTAPGHVPIPVVITDVNGSAIVNINAGDINVKIVHDGTDPSSIRIGDGTSLAAIIATINSLKTDFSSIGGVAPVDDNASGTTVTKVMPVGGKALSSLPTYSDADMAMLQTNLKGLLRTICYFNTTPTGSGTDTIPVVDVDGHFQVDILTMPTNDPGNVGNVKNTNIGVTATQIYQGAPLTCKKVIFSCPDTNTAKISIGGSAVELGYGITLYPGDSSDAYPCNSVGLWYAIAESAGDKVGITYLT